MATSGSLLIPLFPLHTVLFPGALLPLHVFEERYRLLVRERLDFGVVLIRRGSEVGPGRAEELHEVGTLATPERVEPLPDGRFAVLVRGRHRFRLLGLDHNRPYLMGRVEPIEGAPEQARGNLVSLLDRYRALHGIRATTQPAQGSAQSAVWRAGSVLRVEPPRLQQLLETGDEELAAAMLRDELAKLEHLGRLGPVARRPQSLN